MVETWWLEINAFLHTGFTNARTEGYNRLVKTVNAPHAGFVIARIWRDGYAFTAPRTAGCRTSDFMLIARTKLKSRYMAKQGSKFVRWATVEAIQT